MMSPMLAATSWAEQSSTASTRPRAKAWAAEVIRSLYDLGANFKIPTRDHPEWQGVPAYGESIVQRVIQDPLYQFIKHQIRDVTQQDIEEFRKAEAPQNEQSIAAAEVEVDAQSDGSKTSATASPGASNVSNSSQSSLSTTTTQPEARKRNSMQPVLSNSKRMQPVATTSSTQSRRRNAAQNRNAN